MRSRPRNTSRRFRLPNIASGDAQKFQFLYEALSIADGKASSLLTFNGIGLAALAIWLQGAEPTWFHVTLDVAFLLFLLSSIFCLTVVSLHWSSTREINDLSRALPELLLMRERRTARYRYAWYSACLAVIVTTGATLYHSQEIVRCTFHSTQPMCAEYKAECCPPAKPVE